MRDSYGGAFMFSIVFVFIVLFVSFLTITVNFAKVFRIKNTIIDILEQSQYVMNGTDWHTDQVVLNKIDPYLDSFAYRNGENLGVKNHCKDQGGLLTKYGACIVKIQNRDTEAGSYYRVFVYITGSIPVLGNNIVMPISGDTDIIYEPNYFDKGI